MILKDFQIIINNKDNCVILKNGTILLIKCIFSTLSNEIYMMGKSFLTCYSLYSEPCDSKLFNIKFVNNTFSDDFRVSINDLKQKCIHYPIDETNAIIMPLLHYEKHN